MGKTRMVSFPAVLQVKSLDLAQEILVDIGNKIQKWNATDDEKFVAYHCVIKTIAESSAEANKIAGVNVSMLSIENR